MTKLLKNKMIDAMLTREQKDRNGHGHYIIQLADGDMEKEFNVACCSFLYRGDKVRDYMMVDLFGERGAPADRDQDSDFWRACKLWCEIFPEFFMKQSWTERRKIGAIIKLTKGKFTTNRLAAFLVGHRNLTEYNTQHLFLKAVDAGLTPQQAALISQMFCWGNIGYRLGIPHSIFTRVNWERAALPTLLSFMKDNPIFHPTEEVKRSPQPTFQWNCSEVYHHSQGDRGGDLLIEHLKPTQHTRDAWGDRVSAYEEQAIIDFFKEHLK